MGGFAITLGVITYEEITKCKEPPWPPRIIATGIVFGLLDIFSLVSDELASIMAIGIVAAALVTKGFNPNCGCQGNATPPCPRSCATAQPASYHALAAPAPQQMPQ